MIEVQLACRVAAPIDECWSRLLDLDGISAASRSIERIDVVSSDGAGRTTEWHLVLHGSHLTWTQREDFDGEHHAVRFEMSEGQPLYVGGRWSLSEREGHVEVEFEFEFDFGLPGASAGIDRAIDKVAREVAAARGASLVDPSACRRDR